MAIPRGFSSPARSVTFLTPPITIPHPARSNAVNISTPGPTLAPTMPPTTPPTSPTTADEVWHYKDIIDVILSSDVSDPKMLTASAFEAASQDAKTPQQEALNWMIFNDSLKMNTTGYPDERIAQRYAVAVLYFGTQGVKWINSTGWLTEDHECDWYGLRCEKRDFISHADDQVTVKTEIMAVTELRLEKNDLFGVLPKELVVFQFLNVLALYNNRLGGTVPMQVGNLTNLEKLWIDNNQFYGPLPSELGLLVNLEQIDVFTNNFYGNLPSQVCFKGFLHRSLRCTI